MPLRKPVPLLLLLVLALPVSVAEATEDPDLARARQLLDAERPQEALALLDRSLARKKPNPEALLLRGTAHTMQGDLKSALADLRRALKLDPTLRQGWLNLAGLEIARSRYPEAYDALLKAQTLDPQAPDNGLNLGAVLLLQGKIEQAAPHFEDYIARHPESAEAYYLVASNYALAGQEKAVEYLARAVALDEHMRLRARSDERFVGLASQAYERLLATDSFKPPPGSHTAAAAFPVAYRPDTPKLLYTVLQALERLEVGYKPGIETTPDWALIWSDMRIKLYTQANDTGVVSLSAPAQSFTAAGFERRSRTLFRTIHEILNTPEPVLKRP